MAFVDNECLCVRICGIKDLVQMLLIAVVISASKPAFRSSLFYLCHLSTIDI